MLKPILKITGIILLLIFASALAAPIFFKGRILSLVKSEINKNIVADVTFSDLDISLFRNFPDLSAGIEGLIITGRDEFKKDTLLSAKKDRYSTESFQRDQRKKQNRCDHSR